MLQNIIEIDSIPGIPSICGAFRDNYFSCAWLWRQLYVRTLRKLYKTTRYTSMELHKPGPPLGIVEVTEDVLFVRRYYHILKQLKYEFKILIVFIIYIWLVFTQKMSLEIHLSGLQLHTFSLYMIP